MFQNPGSYSDVEKALSVINTIFTGVAVVLGVAEFALALPLCPVPLPWRQYFRLLILY